MNTIERDADLRAYGVDPTDIHYRALSAEYDIWHHSLDPRPSDISLGDREYLGTP